MNHDQAANAIEDRIVRVRRSTGLNQAEFAKVVGVKHRTYAGWERGEGKPTIELVAALHRKFDVDLHWLMLGHSGDKMSGESASNAARYAKITQVVEQIIEECAVTYAFDRKMLLVLSIYLGLPENDSQALAKLREGFASTPAGVS